MIGQKTEFLKGQEFFVEITGLGTSGEGVGRVNGFTVFVQGVLPGEIAKIQLSVVKKNYAVGTLLAIAKDSPERVEPRCPVFGKCGGCQLQHLSYKAQLEAKREQIQAALIRIGRLPFVDIQPVLSEAPIWYYRNKMLFPTGGVPGQTLLGCYARASHLVIDTKECFIQDPMNNKIMNTTREWMNDYKIQPYAPNAQIGIIRNVMGRVGVKSGEVMAAIVTNGEQVVHINELIARLKKRIPNLASVVQVMNTSKSNVVLRGKTVLLYGKETISDSIGKFKFNVSAKSFFQINSLQTEALYDAAVKMARLTGRETVVEVYCGTGSISMFLAEKARSVIGIELSEEAVGDAWENARANGCDNAEFIAGDAAVELPKLAQDGVKADVVVLDPPRAGCDNKVIEALFSMTPKRIVYVSCNPASLARDVGLLAEQGYVLTKVQPVDMFPMTSHVECVALLEKR